MMQDLVGYAIEFGATCDQLVLVKFSSFQLLGRLHQMIEETEHAHH